MHGHCIVPFRNGRHWLADHYVFPAAQLLPLVLGPVYDSTLEAYDFLLHIVGYIIGNSETGITYGGALRVPMGLTAMPLNYVESYGTIAY